MFPVMNFLHQHKQLYQLKRVYNDFRERQQLVKNELFYYSFI
jgi:hypothetical protein